MGVYQLNNLDIGKLLVGCKVANVALVLRCVPAYRVYGYWPQ